MADRVFQRFRQNVGLQRSFQSENDVALSCVHARRLTPNHVIHSFPKSVDSVNEKGTEISMLGPGDPDVILPPVIQQLTVKHMYLVEEKEDFGG
jgi:hypothetical protein